MFGVVTPERVLTPRSIDLFASIGLVALALLLEPYTTLSLWMIVVVAAFAAAPLLPIESASGRTYDLYYLVGATVPFLFPSIAGTLFTLLLGTTVIRAVRATGQIGPAAFSSDFRRLLGASAYALIVLGAGVPSMIGLAGIAAITVATLGFVTWFAIEVIGRSSVEARDSGVGLRYLLTTAAKDAPLFASLMGAGAIFGVVRLHSEWWVAVVVAAVPFIMTISSFTRYGSVRKTYVQTILALARIPEVAGLGLEGHAERTAELADAVAKDMGLTPQQVVTVRYAALMHDIGRITLTEPTIVERGYTDGDIDRWSSEIMAEADYLSEAAAVVSNHSQPFRRPGEEADPEIPIEAKIVRACSSFDRIVFGEGIRPLEALEKLHRGAAYDFDPKVVASLRLVLGRMGITTV
ncbi:MAG: HD domain-containing protein [Acidimicrobiia bacterium]|nr:HD domain-containing protein [Acidimicrobiia bacterium]